MHYRFISYASKKYYTYQRSYPASSIAVNTFMYTLPDTLAVNTCYTSYFHVYLTRYTCSQYLLYLLLSCIPYQIHLQSIPAIPLTFMYTLPDTLAVNTCYTSYFHVYLTRYTCSQYLLYLLLSCIPYQIHLQSIPAIPLTFMYTLPDTLAVNTCYTSYFHVYLTRYTYSQYLLYLLLSCIPYQIHLQSIPAIPLTFMYTLPDTLAVNTCYTSYFHVYLTRYTCSQYLLYLLLSCIPYQIHLQSIPAIPLTFMYTLPDTLAVNTCYTSYFHVYLTRYTCSQYLLYLLLSCIPYQIHLQSIPAIPLTFMYTLPDTLAVNTCYTSYFHVYLTRYTCSQYLLYLLLSCIPYQIHLQSIPAIPLTFMYTLPDTLAVNTCYTSYFHVYLTRYTCSQYLLYLLLSCIPYQIHLQSIPAIPLTFMYTLPDTLAVNTCYTSYFHVYLTRYTCSQYLLYLLLSCIPYQIHLQSIPAIPLTFMYTLPDTLAVNTCYTSYFHVYLTRYTCSQYLLYLLLSCIPYQIHLQSIPAIPLTFMYTLPDTLAVNTCYTSYFHVYLTRYTCSQYLLYLLLSCIPYQIHLQSIPAIPLTFMYTLPDTLAVNTCYTSHKNNCRTK